MISNGQKMRMDYVYPEKVGEYSSFLGLRNQIPDPTGLIRQRIIQLHIFYQQKYATCIGQHSSSKNLADHLLKENYTIPKGFKDRLVFQTVEVVEPENKNLMLLHTFPEPCSVVLP